MSLLFGGPSTRSAAAGPKHIVEFRAGKMTLKGNTVTPDKRKGLVYVYQSDDSLVHFCWKDRKSGTAEDDLIIFPDDCEFKKCSQCKEGSRVYLLKFKASSRKLFFWMQEPKAEKDEDLVWKVNDALNGGTGTSSSGVGGTRGTTGSGSDSENVTPSGSEADVQNLLGSMSQSQLMQLLGGMSSMGESGLLAQLNQIAPGLANLATGAAGGVATESRSGTNNSRPTESILKKKPPTAATTTSQPATATAGGNSSSSKGAIQLTDLQQILNRMQPNGGSSTGASGSSTEVQVDLSSAVNGESIRRITACPKTVQKLAPLLPRFGGPDMASPDSTGTDRDSTKTQKQVQETLQSPQFQSALSAFCAAFPSRQLGPLISQFGMGQEAIAAANDGNLEGFLNAIQKEVESADTEDGTNEPVESDMNAVD